MSPNNGALLNQSMHYGDIEIITTHQINIISISPAASKTGALLYATQLTEG